MRHVAREITELLKLFLCRYRLRIRLLCGDLALEFLLGFEHLLELLLGMGVDARVFAAAAIHPLQGHFCFVFVSLSFSLNPVLPAFFTPSGFLQRLSKKLQWRHAQDFQNFPLNACIQLLAVATAAGLLSVLDSFPSAPVTMTAVGVILHNKARLTR